MNDVTLTQPQVEHIENQLRDLSHKLQAGLNKLSKIESYLYNDDNTDTVGLVKQVKDHCERLDEMERSEKRTRSFMKWLAVLAGAIGTVIFEFGKWLFTNHKP